MVYVTVNSNSIEISQRI